MKREGRGEGRAKKSRERSDKAKNLVIEFRSNGYKGCLINNLHLNQFIRIHIFF